MDAFSLPFLQTALAAGLLCGTAVAFLGLFILVRRISFSGLAASQLTALGAVVSILADLHWWGFGVAFVLVALGMTALSSLAKVRRVPAEAWVACLYVLGASMSVLVLSKAPMGESHSMTVFFGNMLALGSGEIWEAAAVAAAVALVLGVWFHRWVWTSFDPLSAQVAGLAPERWSLLFWALFSGTLTVSIHLFGVLLTFAYLILPGAAGLIVARRMATLLAVVAGTSCACTVLGVYLSYVWDYPTGPMIAALLCAATLLGRAVARTD